MLARRPWKRAGEDPAWSWEPQSKALAVVGATGQQSPGQVKWCLSQRSCALCEAPKSKRWPRNWMRVYGARGEMEPSWSLGPVLAGGGGPAERLARAFCACTPWLSCLATGSWRQEEKPSHLCKSSLQQQEAGDPISPPWEARSPPGPRGRPPCSCALGVPLSHQHVGSVPRRPEVAAALHWPQLLSTRC